MGVLDDYSSFTVSQLRKRASWLEKVAHTRRNEPGIADRILADRDKVLAELSKRS
jgi:hypothetical protein